MDIDISQWNIEFESVVSPNVILVHYRCIVIVHCCKIS